ncbi:MAG TPA: ADP-ribosylglycohydrolase family protein [Bryobacteraceae bacterium]|nr:ADP-ribosylglycohydrolase family protein [Bryobacteraceae bacterium]HOQ46993.1 ADP-ribosylglycohydrolase family protein [Bryobacteraceae bacterium]HPQ15894.1 ADP-ribosylglycohydrolase family protein [Bryobacteraceae bacterium]HPU73080.1 ADP-ribosylglycohydrolase family protein [Bryobacteraceae bacterium]
MSNSGRRLATILSATLFSAGILFAQKPLRLSLAEYQDRVHAAWLGQIIGTLAGFEFEGKAASSPLVMVDRIPRRFKTAPVDDDYYYELVALRAFEKYGVNMTLDQLGEQWKENSAGSWGSSAQTRMQLAKGVPGSQAGHPRYNRLWWTIGPQFSGDTYGLIAPGDPNLAGKLAREYGHINGYAVGTDGGVFVAGMVSLAFRESDPKTIVRQAARLIHPSSPYRQCIDMVIAMAEKGASPEEVFRAIEDRWRIEYPAMNNAVANGGLVAASVWFGEGDYLKTINLAFRAADFSDADCNAANAGAVVGAMKGTKALPQDLIAALQDRIQGDKMGPVALTPPVDESISDIARRIAALGQKMITTRGEGKIVNGEIRVPYRPVVTQPAETFSPAEFTKFWDPAWTLERAGLGGSCGGTHLNGDVLVTFPRDEYRGLLLRRKVKLGAAPVLELEVAADGNRAWRLDVFVNNARLLDRVIEGPASRGRGDWQQISVDLSKFSGQEVEIRLYQVTQLADKLSSCAYWRKAVVASK